ncbi:hypothetical protein GWK47_042189 [Chionoecetes opilio]|uniref:Uncharacterized protein n=1 Tax=Chionoecetes opilio TaxID=41210 RepID=A0A8J4YGB1_CHIOP|nr:hypothetical protein GWK47_042189 [Chionoecetes opilio]
MDKCGPLHGTTAGNAFDCSGRPTLYQELISSQELEQPFQTPEVFEQLQEHTDHQVAKNHLSPATVTLPGHEVGQAKYDPKWPQNLRLFGKKPCPTTRRPYGLSGYGGYYEIRPNFAALSGAVTTTGRTSPKPPSTNFKNFLSQGPVLSLPTSPNPLLCKQMQTTRLKGLYSYRGGGFFTPAYTPAVHIHQQRYAPSKRTPAISQRSCWNAGILGVLMELSSHKKPWGAQMRSFIEEKSFFCPKCEGPVWGRKYGDPNLTNLRRIGGESSWCEQCHSSVYFTAYAFEGEAHKRPLFDCDPLPVHGGYPPKRIANRHSAAKQHYETKQEEAWRKRCVANPQQHPVIKISGNEEC